MNHYNARVETDQRGPLSEADVDRYMDALAAYAPSISVSAYGNVTARITVPADTVGQAAGTATAVVEQITRADTIGLELFPEDEFDRRQGYEPVPELIGVGEAAAILGVSEQRVRQMIDEGKVAAHRIGGRTFALTRSEVEAKAAN